MGGSLFSTTQPVNWDFHTLEEGGMFSLTLMKSSQHCQIFQLLQNIMNIKVQSPNTNISAGISKCMNIYFDKVSISLRCVSNASLAPIPQARSEGWLVCQSVRLSDFHLVWVSEQSRSVHSDLWPFRHLIRVIRGHDLTKKNYLSTYLSTYQGWTPRPAPQNWRNPQGAAGQNWLQIPLIPLSIMPANDALKEERVWKSFHFSLFTNCDCLLHRNTFKSEGR